MGRLKGTSIEERKIMLYIMHNEYTIEVCDDKNNRHISRKEYDTYRKNTLTSPYVLIKAEERNESIKSLSLTEQYKLKVEEADELKQLTNGKINLYKTGSIVHTSLQLFEEYRKIQPTDITEIEQEFIENCYNASMRYAV